MCTCKQKSKKPAGSPGNFNYVFVCTKEDGTVSELKITAGNDNEAKILAEVECKDSKKIQAIQKIIIDDFETLKVLLNTDYSNHQLLIVSFWGTNKWFNIPSSTVDNVVKIGYGICENRQYPLVEITIKENLSTYRNDIIKLRWSLLHKDPVIDIPSFDEIVSTSSTNLEVKELSGAQWVARFPGSSSIGSLVSPFKENVQRFYDALITASASAVISATLRPTERAFLMRTSYDIANEIIAPGDAGKLAGVNIEWVHPTLQASIKAATAMVTGYGIVYQPAYPTKHSDGTAIDMNITWTGSLKIRKADGNEKEIATTPRNNSNSELQQVANTYSVYKLVSDPPHWSDDGH